MDPNDGNIVKDEDDSQSPEDDQKIDKSILTYKDTISLIKKKITNTHALIKQYNDKIKEYNNLKEELAQARSEKQDIVNKHNISMEKIAHLEMRNEEQTKSIEKYKDINNKQKVKLDENEKHINQLGFKIKEMEEEVESLKVENKLLQQDVKPVKVTKIVEKKSSSQMKQQACQTLYPEMKNISVNTDPIKQKPVMKDKSVLTDEKCKVSKEPFPFYCTKCKIEIIPAPIPQILQIMTHSPPLLSADLSPSKSNKIKSTAGYKSSSNNILLKENENFKNFNQPLNYEKDFKRPSEVSVNMHDSSFMEIDKLTRKIDKLETSMKKMKNKKKQKNCCHQDCCSSKNIQFVVKFPNKKYFEYSKRKSNKIEKFKHLNIKKQKLKRKNTSMLNEWQIEDCSEPKKKKISKLEKRRLKKGTITSQKNKDILEYPEVLNYDAKSSVNIISPSTSEKSLSPIEFIDSPTHNTSSKISETNLYLSSQSISGNVNINKSTEKCTSRSCISEPIQPLVYENEVRKKNILHSRTVYIEENEQLIAVNDNNITANSSAVKISSENVQKMNLLSEDVHEEDVVSKMHDLDVRKENIEETNPTISIITNEEDIKKCNSIVEVSSDQFSINKDINVQNNLVNSQTINIEGLIPQEIINDSLKMLNEEDSTTNHNTSIENVLRNMPESPINKKNEKACKNELILNSDNKDNIKNNSAYQMTNNNSDEDQLLRKNDLIIKELINEVNENTFMDGNIAINEKIKECENENEHTFSDDSFNSNFDLESKPVPRLIVEDVNFIKQEKETNIIKSDLKNFHILPVIVTPDVSKSDIPLDIDKIQETDLSLQEHNNRFDINKNTFIEQNFISEQTSEISKENILSDDHSESSESMFFSASGIKRNKHNSVNVILSDESVSNESEKNIKMPTVKRRRKLKQNLQKNTELIKKKKLLSKIRNIKKISKKTVIVNKSESSIKPNINWNFGHLNTKTVSLGDSNIPIESPSKSKVSDENSSTSMPLNGKQRIAHKPKSINYDIDNEFAEKLKTIVDPPKSIIKKETVDTKDKLSLLMEEYDKTCKERAVISRILNPVQPVDSVSFKSLINNNVNFKESQQENLFENNKCTILPITSPSDSINNRENDTNKNLENIQNLNVSETLTHECNIDKTFEENKLGILTESKNQFIALETSSQESIVDETFEENELRLLTEGEKIENKCTGKQRKRKKEGQIEQNGSPVKELRSRHIVLKNENLSKKLKTDTQLSIQAIDKTNSCLGDTAVVSALNKYLLSPPSSINSRKRGINKTKTQIIQRLVEEKLTLLINAEEWTTAINEQVAESFSNLEDLRAVANFLIEYVAEKLLEDEIMDKSHTPPAPIMTRSEQKIITLILSIDKTCPEFSKIVISGIQFKLFKLGNPQQVQIVERLFRILVVLNKIKKDREKVRILCCDALYCLTLRAVNIIYVALMCWPEIFPKHDSNNDILIKTIVHIIMTIQVNKPYPKLATLRKLLSTVYEYPNSGYMSNNFKLELMKNLKENVPGTNTAIILLCKKMGPSWSFEKIVNGGLKQMIVERSHPSLYDALTLLGNIIRSYPRTDPNNKVGEIIDQLCDVLNAGPSDAASDDDLQEGVVSCLLCINKFKYEQIARSVINWQFNKDLRPVTKDKLDSFFKVHDAQWWWKFIISNFSLSKKD